MENKNRLFRSVRYGLIIAGLILFTNFSLNLNTMAKNSLSLLTDPFLQLPTQNSVNVVWFTEFKSDRSYVSYGENLDQTIDAVTTKLSRT